MSPFESYIDNFAKGNIVVSLAHTYVGIPRRISLPRPPRYNLGGAAVGTGVVVGEMGISSNQYGFHRWNRNHVTKLSKARRAKMNKVGRHLRLREHRQFVVECG